MNKSIFLSLPRAKRVHGVRVRKLPVGLYLKSMDLMGRLLPEAVEAVFPGKSLTQALEALTSVTGDELAKLILRLFTTLPGTLLDLTSQLMDVPVKRLRDDLSPKELMDVWQAFWELNQLTDFFRSLARLLPARRVRETGNPSCSG